MNSIKYNISRDHFIKVALPYLIERCPSLNFHFVFVNNEDKQFEDLCCVPGYIQYNQIQDTFNFNRVKIYGSSVCAMKECVDIMLEERFVDRHAAECSIWR